MADNGQGRKKMTEEEKKAKFGDAYDPNFKPKPKGKEGGQEGDKESEKDKGDPRGKRGVPWKNDWRFYALTEEIARSVASIPFNTLSGVPQEIEVGTQGAGNDAGGNVNKTKVIWNPQSVMALNYSPGFAVQIEPNDNPDEEDTTFIDNGLNMAATQLYTYLRHVNSGAKNYEAPDVIIYVLAMRDIYNEYCELRRALGVVNYFNLENRALPRQLCRALGFDYNDLIGDTAKYRGQLNIIAKRINSYAMPKYFKAFDRAAYISSCVFADSDSMRGQFYVFKKMGYYTWDPTNTNGSSLVFATHYTNASGTGVKMSTRIARLQAMLDALQTDTDVNTISGDILHAFQDAELYQFPQIPDEYVVVPVMDEDILAQIENSISLSAYGFSGDLLGTAENKATFNVTQAQGKVAVWEPSITRPLTYGGAVQLSRYVFNSHKDNNDYTDNLEWSRLMVVADVTYSAPTKGNVIIKVRSCGLELLWGYVIFDVTGETYSVPQSVNVASGTNIPTAAAFGIMRIQQYDWHPFIYGFSNKSIAVAGDLKRYTLIEASVITNIHDAANAASYYADGIYGMKR